MTGQNDGLKSMYEPMKRPKYRNPVTLLFLRFTQKIRKFRMKCKQNTTLRIVFLTYFLVVGNVVKYCLSCLFD